MMENDDNLDKLFEGFGSGLEPDGVFLSRLEKRLALADLIKQRERQQKRQLGYCIIASMLLGAALGAFLVWASLNIPVDIGSMSLVWSIGTLNMGSLIKTALVIVGSGVMVFLVLRLAMDKLRSQLF